MRRAAGFTYMTVLFIVAIMGAGLALVGEVWHTAAVREKEAELLHVGNQYRRAIERYYLSGPRLYPRSLSDLLKDTRKPVTERYLRRLYPDPMTGRADWGLIKAPDGGIMGVYSLSDDAPLKTAGFRARDQQFLGATQYREWKFVYELQSAAALQSPASGAAAPATVTPPAPPR